MGEPSKDRRSEFEARLAPRRGPWQRLRAWWSCGPGPPNPSAPQQFTMTYWRPEDNYILPGENNMKPSLGSILYAGSLFDWDRVTDTKGKCR